MQFRRLAFRRRLVLVAKVPLPVRPELGVSSADQQNGRVPEAAVSSLPSLQVVRGQCGVTVQLTAVLDVNQSG